MVWFGLQASWLAAVLCCVEPETAWGPARDLATGPRKAAHERTEPLRPSPRSQSSQERQLMCCATSGRTATRSANAAVSCLRGSICRWARWMECCRTWWGAGGRRDAGRRRGSVVGTRVAGLPAAAVLGSRRWRGWHRGGGVRVGGARLTKGRKACPREPLAKRLVLPWPAPAPSSGGRPPRQTTSGTPRCRPALGHTWWL